MVSRFPCENVLNKNEISAFFMEKQRLAAPCDFYFLIDCWHDIFDMTYMYSVVFIAERVSDLSLESSLRVSKFFLIWAWGSL